MSLSSRTKWAIAAAVFVLIGIVGYSKIELKESVLPGLKPAPSFLLPKFDGKTFDLDSLEDHVVVVHFWAAWCAPCIPEIPEILSIAGKLPKDREGRPIYWVFVTQDPNWEKAHKIFPETMITENVISVIDSEAKISDKYGSYQFPETYLITRNGKLAAKWIGPQEWSGEWGKHAMHGIEQLSRLQELPGAVPTR